MALSYPELRRFAETSAAVTLLRGDNFIEDLAFLSSAFRSEGHVVIPETELRITLKTWLELNFEADPERHPGWKPVDRIAHYVKQEFLRKREPADRSEPVYELTSEIDRLLAWLEDQRRREFVGTEYGLKAIMRDLREAAARASGDWQQRMNSLVEQKAEIERQIREIEDDPERAKKTDSRYVWETVQRMERAGQDLVGDFSVLRERFTDLARDVARKHGSTTFTRGDALRLALDGEDALRITPMGESFYGFWRLVASSERDEFVSMVRTIYATPGIPEDVRSRRLLLGLLDRLREQGQVVLDANRQLTRHVRRALDREDIETRRLMASRVHDLQLLLLAHRGELDDLDGVEVDERIHLNLPLDRPMYEPPESVVIDTVLSPSETADIREAARQIAKAGVIDFRRLLQSLDDHIEANEAKGLTGVTLSAHLERHPPRQGVLELLGYVHLARVLAGDCELMEHKPFCWRASPTRDLVCPDVFFLSVKRLLK